MKLREIHLKLIILSGILGIGLSNNFSLNNNLSFLFYVITGLGSLIYLVLYKKLDMTTSKLEHIIVIILAILSIIIIFFN